MSRVTILSRVTCSSPANAFQPPLTILSSMTRVDWATGVAPYEFYREKAWQVSPRVYCITCIMSRVRPATPSPISLRRPASPRAGRCWPGSSGEHNKYNEHYQYQVSQVCDIGASPRGLAAGRDHRGHHHLLRRDEEQGAEGLREARAAAAAQQQGGVIVSNQD